MRTHQRSARRNGDDNAIDVRRDECTSVLTALEANSGTRDELLHAMREIRQQLEIQFRRIAQMQVEIDGIKSMLAKPIVPERRTL